MNQENDMNTFETNCEKCGRTIDMQTYYHTGGICSPCTIDDIKKMVKLKAEQ